MALPAPLPARLFAELVPAQTQTPTPTGVSPAPPGREMHVSGSAELSAGPDRARVSLRLGSRKEEAGAARSSVARRLEYIAQTARQRGVPEENMTITEDFSRVENTYQMEAELPELEATRGTEIRVDEGQQWHGSPNLDPFEPQLKSTWTWVCSAQLCHQLAASKAKLIVSSVIDLEFCRYQVLCES